MNTQALQGGFSSIVHLDPEDHAKLESLAAAEHTSADEILRRIVRSYDPASTSSEEEIATALLAVIDEAIGHMSESLRSAHESVQQSLDTIDNLREARQ